MLLITTVPFWPDRRARVAAVTFALLERPGPAAAIAILAVLPLVPLPFRAGRPEPVPAGWTAAPARLRLTPAHSVLVVPASPEVMRGRRGLASRTARLQPPGDGASSYLAILSYLNVLVVIRAHCLSCRKTIFRPAAPKVYSTKRAGCFRGYPARDIAVSKRPAVFVLRI